MKPLNEDRGIDEKRGHCRESRISRTTSADSNRPACRKRSLERAIASATTSGSRRANSRLAATAMSALRLTDRRWASRSSSWSNSSGSEIGNVLLRSLGWSGSKVADQLKDLVLICGAPLNATMGWLHEAAELGERFGLTYYDAAWGAAARSLAIPLVSADKKLLAAGLAESPTNVAQRLGLFL